MKPIHIMLLKLSVDIKRYDGQTKWMYFLIEDDGIFNKCNTIWGKVSSDIKKEFNSKPVYNKTKTKK